MYFCCRTSLKTFSCLLRLQSLFINFNVSVSSTLDSELLCVCVFQFGLFTSLIFEGMKIGLIRGKIRRILNKMQTVLYKRFMSLAATRLSGAPKDNFRKNVCSEDDLRSRIFRTFVVKFLACLPLLGFSDI